MIEYEILEDDAVVIVEPGSRLTAEDFQKLAHGVDAFLDQNDSLNGLLIHMESFPGWEDFSGLIQHFKFVRNHHEQIRRVAFASDSRLAKIAPRLAEHFVSAEVRGFDYEDYDDALAWLREP